MEVKNMMEMLSGTVAEELAIGTMLGLWTTIVLLLVDEAIRAMLAARLAHIVTTVHPAAKSITWSVWSIFRRNPPGLVGRYHHIPMVMIEVTMGIAARLVFGRPTDDDWLVVFHELGHHRFDHMLTRRSCVRLGTIATQLDRGMVAAWRSVGWQCGVDAKIRINSRRIIRRALLSTGLKHAELVGIHELFANMFAGAMFAKMFGRAPVTVAYPDDEMLFSICLHHLEYPGRAVAQEQIIEGTKMYLNGGHPFGM